MTSSPSVLRPRVVLVGDRSNLVQAHTRIPVLFDGLSRTGGIPIEVYWLHSTEIEQPADVAGFDGVWVVPGSPYTSPDGVMAAVQWAREEDVPFLGTCGGFQYMLLELARHVCGVGGAEHAETHPEAEDLLLVPLACSLLGEEAEVTIRPGTVAAAAMGAGRSTERYFCRYGLNTDYLARLEAAGLVVSGRDRGGEVRVAELAGRDFFVGSLFQPELSSDRTWVHPLITAFAAAVCRHAQRRSAAHPGGPIATAALTPR